jgi:hypothetical protein
MQGLLLHLTAVRQNIWIRRSGFAITGALMGFAYYYFIGCYSGTCPISGNPYISTAYGAVIGMLIFTARNKPDR